MTATLTLPLTAPLEWRPPLLSALAGWCDRGGSPRVRLVEDARAAELERERLLVERAQAGDRRALGEILRQHGPALFRAVLLPRLGSASAAEEALGVTYAKVVEKIGLFAWQSVGIYPWLRMVAIRVALDQLRARKREVPFDVDDLAREVDRAERGASEDADAGTLAREDAAWAKTRVEKALSAIHPRYATAIRLRVLEEQPRDACAQALGVTTATFDVVLHRALSAMRKALGPDGEEDS